MVGRRDDDQRVIAEHRGTHRDFLRRASHQRDVDVVVLQTVDGFGAVADGEPHVDVGMFLHEAGHQPRREILGGGDDAEPQTADAHTLDRIHLVFEQAKPLLDRLRRLDEGQTCGSRTHAIRRPVEQGQLELLLDLPQLDRHRWRRQA